MSELSLSSTVVNEIIEVIKKHDSQASNNFITCQYLCAVIGYLLSKEKVSPNDFNEILNDYSGFIKYVFDDLNNSSAGSSESAGQNAFGVWKPGDWMSKILLIGFFGAIGTLLRYFISSSALKNIIYFDIPIAILFINILGSFFFGLILSSTSEGFYISRDFQLYLTTGLLAAFTTFSTFSWEVVEMINSKLYMNALIYSFTSVLLCVLFCWLGYIILRT